MPQSLALSLLLTYRGLKRAQNMFSSRHSEELQISFKVLEDLPQIYWKIRALGYEEDVELECHLRKLRKSTYHFEKRLCLMTSDWESSDLKYDLRRLLRKSASDLEAISASNSTVKSIESIADDPAFLSSTRKNTGASSLLLYYDGSEETIVGRESEKKQVLDWIFNPPSDNQQQHPTVISITGDEGIGKTTLAKMIYNVVIQVSTSFDLVSWVDMASYNYGQDFKSVIADIVKSFTNGSWYDLQRMGTEMLEGKLLGILEGQKYLLVLDNYKIGQRAEWDKLRKILVVGSAGSTVIVTSEQGLEGTSSFELGLPGLPKKYCQSLLSECAGFNEEADPFLKSIKESIADKCCGCPLAIKTLGKTLLANRDKHGWRQIDETESYPTREALIRSLEYMPFDMAQCVLGSVVLPLNKVMSRDQLLYLWMAQGLVEPTEINEDPGDIVDSYCNELLSLAFFQSCQTDGHDVILRHHNQALNLALDILGEEPGASDLLEHPRSLMRKKLQGLEPSKLSLLERLSMRNFMRSGQVDRISKCLLTDLFTILRHARVLLLDGFEFEELPAQISDLKQLRYLSLAGNYILQQLPDSIESLRFLQTLDLSGCEQLQTLPRYMNKRSSLRHLLLSMKLTALPNAAIGCWTSLHHFKLCNCPNLSSISEGIAYLTALRVLQIHDCPLIASLPNNMKHLTFLKELSIRNCEKLDLTNWDGLEGLEVLKSLRFQGIPKLSKFPEGLQSAADSLQHLLVINCGNLTALPECLQTCTNLLELIIDNCPNMGTLPKGIQTIKALQVLKIVNCPTLIPRYQRGAGEDWHLISHIPKIQLQTRNRGISPFEKHPGALVNVHADAVSGEKRLDKQEAEVKRDELPTAGTSSQDEDSLPEPCVEEMLNPCNILLLLPDDYEIEKDTLIQLWMAGKYIKDEPMELQGEQLFRLVLGKGYLSRSGTDFMTGKYRYRASWWGMRRLQIDDQQDRYLIWDGEDSFDPAAESAQHVSLARNDTDETVFQKLQQFNKLRTLVFFANRGHRVKNIPGRLFSGLKNLQALDLSRTSIRELPSSVRHMIQLRYLNLSWTLIECLPDTVCSLVELQTLKLRGCTNLCELPEQLASLTKLRHLDVDALLQLETMPKGIGALVNLRTLPAFLVGTEDGCKIQELKQLNNLSGFLCIAKLEHVESAEEARGAALDKKQHLQKLELRWTAAELSGPHNNSHEILECLRPCTSLEELQILCYEGPKLPHWITDVKFNKLARIVVYGCENLSELPQIEQLPHLKHLELIMMNSVKKIKGRGELEKGVFPALEKLEIKDMQRLEVWDWKKRDKSSDFKSLAEVIINDCPQLERIDVLPHLSSIKHFHIRECPKLKLEVPSSYEELIVEDCPLIQIKCLEEGGTELNNQSQIPNPGAISGEKRLDKQEAEVKRDEFPTAGTSSQADVHYSPNETTLNQPNREHEATHEVQQISSRNDNLQEHDTTNEDQQTPPTTTDQTTTRTENLQMEMNLEGLERISHKILVKADIDGRLAVPVALINHIWAQNDHPQKDCRVLDRFGVEWNLRAHMRHDQHDQPRPIVYGPEWMRFLSQNHLQVGDQLVFYRPPDPNRWQVSFVVGTKRGSQQ